MPTAPVSVKSVPSKLIPIEFISTVTKLKQLTPDVKLFTLTAPAHFTFKAGQFVMVNITHNGVMKPRAYSILNQPSKKKMLELCIKIVPGGFASEVLSSIKVGDEFSVRGPFGNFCFVEDAMTESAINKVNTEEHWFIAVGTGIVPFYSMLEEYLPQTAYKNKRFKLIFSSRYQKGLLFFKELTSLAKIYPNFSYLPTVTREKWAGKTGRVQTHLTGNLQNKIFYICGLKEMVEETSALLESKGVKKEKIRLEKYG